MKTIARNIFYLQKLFRKELGTLTDRLVGIHFIFVAVVVVVVVVVGIGRVGGLGVDPLHGLDVGLDQDLPLVEFPDV